MTEQTHESPYKWLETFDRLKAEGHHLQCHDDVVTRQLGFDDLTEGIWHTCRKIHVSAPHEVVGPEADHEKWLPRIRALRTQQARNELFSNEDER